MEKCPFKGYQIDICKKIIPATRKFSIVDTDKDTTKAFWNTDCFDGFSIWIQNDLKADGKWISFRLDERSAPEIKIYHGGMHYYNGLFKPITFANIFFNTNYDGGLPMTYGMTDCVFRVTTNINLAVQEDSALLEEINNNIIGGIVRLQNHDLYTGTINGTNRIFTATRYFIGNTTTVFINGILQYPGGVDYDEVGGNSIVFVAGKQPHLGDYLDVNYQYV